jgi:hypothetical protein
MKRFLNKIISAIICLSVTTNLFADNSVIGDEIIRKSEDRQFTVETLDGNKYKGYIVQITDTTLTVLNKKSDIRTELQIENIKHIKKSRNISNTILNSAAIFCIIITTSVIIGLSTLE